VHYSARVALRKRLRQSSISQYCLLIANLLARQLTLRKAPFGMVLRFLGYVFLCLAIAALAYDGIRMIADNGQLAFTSLEQHWLNISPASMEAVRGSPMASARICGALC